MFHQTRPIFPSVDISMAAWHDSTKTIHGLIVEHMNGTETEYTFHIVERLKHTCPGVHQKPLCFIKYEIEPRLVFTDI